MDSLLSFRKNRTVLYGSVAACILIVVVSALAALMHLRREAERRVVATTQNLALSLEQTIAGVIDPIDVALLAATDEISQQMSAGKIDRQSITDMLIRQQQRLTLVDGLRATNEQGQIIYGPDVLSPPIDASDREYFVRLRDDSNTRLFISKPFVGRLDRLWVWLFARRINKSDGSFGGVVFARLPITRLDEMLAQIKMQPGSVIALRDSEFGLIARNTFNIRNPLPIGDKRLSTPFQNILKLNPQEGTYVSDKTNADGISRTYSYRRSAKYGFTVLVGIDVDAAMDEWRNQAGIIAGLIAAFVLAALAFSWSIIRAWQHKEQDMAVLQASQESLHNAQKIANLGHYSYDFKADLFTTSDILDDIVGIDAGYPRDSRHWTELVAADCRQNMQTCLNTLIQQHQPFDHEYRIVRPCDDRERWVHAKGKLQLDARGTPLAILGTIQDITERKQMEEELKRSNSELEQFSYAISHDMRQPLRMISSYLQLIESELAGQLDGEIREYLNFATDGAKRLDQMLVGLLEYSRVGRMGEPPVWVESRAILDEALLFLQPAIAEAQAKVLTQGEWPRVLVSSNEMLRLLQNLIDNAVKFRVPGRTPEITITSETVGKEWRVDIADNGAGILSDQIGRLFQVFQRLQSRAAYAGSGIGLALCRKIIEHHGGRIWAESPGEGLGSRFIFELPLRSAKLSAETHSA